MATFQRKMAELAESDPAGTAAFYNKTFPEISFSRDRLMRDLSAEIDNLAIPFERRADNAEFAGLAGVTLLLLSSVFAVRYLTTTLRTPLHKLVEALERMRQGDFTERLGTAKATNLGR